MKPANVDPELMTLLDNELLAGEDLKWVGHPDPMRMARQQLANAAGGMVLLFVMVLFFIFWFSSFSYGVSTTESPLPGFAALLPLLLFGKGLYDGLQPVFQYIMALRTIYAITNRRIITLK